MVIDALYLLSSSFMPPTVKALLIKSIHLRIHLSIIIYHHHRMKHVVPLILISWSNVPSCSFLFVPSVFFLLLTLNNKYIFFTMRCILYFFFVFCFFFWLPFFFSCFSRVLCFSLFFLFSFFKNTHKSKKSKNKK